MTGQGKSLRSNGILFTNKEKGEPPSSNGLIHCVTPDKMFKHCSTYRVTFFQMQQLLCITPDKEHNAVSWTLYTKFELILILSKINQSINKLYLSV